MRKICSISFLLIPYLYFLGLGTMALFQPEGDLYLSVLLALPPVLNLIFSVLYAIFSCRKREDPRKVAFSNMMQKCTAIAADVAVLAVGIAVNLRYAQLPEDSSFGEALGAAIGMILILILMIPYGIIRINSLISCAVVGTVTAKRNGVRLPFLHMLLHLIPVADLISAVIVYKNVKKHETIPEVQVEE